MEYAPLFVPSAKGHTAGKWPCWDRNDPSGPRVQERVDVHELLESLIKCFSLCSGNTDSTTS